MPQVKLEDVGREGVSASSSGQVHAAGDWPPRPRRRWPLMIPAAWSAWSGVGTTARFVPRRNHQRT